MTSTLGILVMVPALSLYSSHSDSIPKLHSVSQFFLPHLSFPLQRSLKRQLQMPLLPRLYINLFGLTMFVNQMKFFFSPLIRYRNQSKRNLKNVQTRHLIVISSKWYSVQLRRNSFSQVPKITSLYLNLFIYVHTLHIIMSFEFSFFKLFFFFPRKVNSLHLTGFFSQ